MQQHSIKGILGIGSRQRIPVVYLGLQTTMTFKTLESELSDFAETGQELRDTKVFGLGHCAVVQVTNVYSM